MIEALVRPVPEEVLQSQMIGHFNRMVGLDLIMDEYMTEVNQREGALDPRFLEEVTFTRTLIKKCAFGALVDIMDYGDDKMKLHALNVIKSCDRYRRGEVDDVVLGGQSARETTMQLAAFVHNLMGLTYYNRYLSPHLGGMI